MEVTQLLRSPIDARAPSDDQLDALDLDVLRALRVGLHKQWLALQRIGSHEANSAAALGQRYGERPSARPLWSEDVGRLPPMLNIVEKAVWAMKRLVDAPWDGALDVDAVDARLTFWLAMYDVRERMHAASEALCRRPGYDPAAKHRAPLNLFGATFVDADALRKT